MADGTGKRSSRAAIALAWMVVTVPALWGLTYTVENALKLFTAKPAPASAPVAGTPGR